MRAEWFVLWVTTGQEKALCDKAARIPGVLRTLCPEQELWKRREGAWVQERQLLFPSYLFLRCAMNSAIYYDAKELPGVLGWLGKDALWPSTVPQEEMDAVLALMQGSDPEKSLTDVEINKRQRRGYGTLCLQGKRYRIPFNVYRQAEDAPGDSSPGTDEAEQERLSGEEAESP